MWRFYVAATAIVAAFVFFVTNRHAPPPDLKVSSRASGAPSASRTQSGEAYDPGAVRGEAPWALSALPDCAHQVLEARGSRAAILAKIPPGAQPLAGEINAGPCKIRIAGGGILVTRGSDQLRVPAPASLFVSHRSAGERYYLYRPFGERAELREYTLAGR
jgi:hypothetical protein